VLDFTPTPARPRRPAATPVFVMSDLDIGMNTALQPFEWDDKRAYDRDKG